MGLLIQRRRGSVSIGHWGRTHVLASFQIRLCFSITKSQWLHNRRKELHNFSSTLPPHLLWKPYLHSFISINKIFIVVSRSKDLAWSQGHCLIWWWWQHAWREMGEGKREEDRRKRCRQQQWWLAWVEGGKEKKKKKEKKMKKKMIQWST